MPRFARILDGRAVELMVLPDDVQPADAFAPALAATIVPCPDETVGVGHLWSGGAFAPPPDPTPAEIAAAKAGLMAAIDAEAERIRLRLITPGAGQAMEYQEAQRQALLALDDPAPAAASYPMLAASIGIDVDPDTGGPAGDVAGVARSVIAARDQWLVIGSEVRRVRLSAKAAIDAATTIAAAEAARAGAPWPALG